MPKDFIDPLIANNLWEPLPPMEQITIEGVGRWYVDIDEPDDKFYSVTTVIDKAKSATEKQGLADWSRGEIKKLKNPRTAALEGEHMHELIEYYYKRGYEYPPAKMLTSYVIPEVKADGEVIIPETTSSRGVRLFKNYHEHFLKSNHLIPHIIEGKVKYKKKHKIKSFNDPKKRKVYEVKYAGTIDLVATWVGEEGDKKLVVVDHKSCSDMKYVSGRRKKYLPQLAAYACAIEAHYGITVDGAMLNFSSTKDSRPNKRGADLAKFKSYYIDKEELIKEWEQFKHKFAKFIDKGDMPGE